VVYIKFNALIATCNSTHHAFDSIRVSPNNKQTFSVMSLQDKEIGQPASAEPVAEQTAQGPSFPEGGLRAWTVVAGSFCILFCSFGYLNAYG
jgi:hypothetical protein